MKATGQPLAGPLPWIRDARFI